MSWVSERVGQLLAETGLSTTQVARDLAIERSQLSQILAGTRTPNEVLTRRLATYFGEEPELWVQGNAATGSPAPQVQAVSDGFVRVASIEDVPAGTMIGVLEGSVAVANIAGVIYAFDSTCPHAGANLSEGFLDACVVQCPWHRGRWDVRTGEALTMLATSDLQRFEVRVRGSDIEVRQDGSRRRSGPGDALD